MTIEKLLIYPDTHIPAHHVKAFALVNKVGKEWRPDQTIILGDFGDWAAVSGHDETLATRANFVQEVRAVKKGLADVKAVGARKNVFLMGNHSYRLDRYMMKKAPELQEAIGVDGLLGLTESGFDVYPYREAYRVGNMRFVHDLSYAGKGAAGKSMEAIGRNVVIGHTHRMEMMVGGTLEGERHVGASFGWLGDVNQITYMSKDKARKDWTLGFGLGYHDTQTGFVTLVPVPILPDANGGLYCLIAGQKVSVK